MLKLFTILLIISIVYITLQTCNKIKGGDAIGYLGFHDGNQYFRLGDSKDVLVNAQEDLDDTARGIYGMDGYTSSNDYDNYDDYDN